MGSATNTMDMLTGDENSGAQIGYQIPTVFISDVDANLLENEIDTNLPTDEEIIRAFKEMPTDDEIGSPRSGSESNDTGAQNDHQQIKKVLKSDVDTNLLTTSDIDSGLPTDKEITRAFEGETKSEISTDDEIESSFTGSENNDESSSTDDDRAEMLQRKKTRGTLTEFDITEALKQDYDEITALLAEDEVLDEVIDVPVVHDHLFKILIIGEYGVGKTSIIRRYANNTFDDNYKLTIGVDFTLKTLRWDANTRVTLQLWDIAGHERFSSLTRCYYKYAVGAIVVYDLTRMDTFVALSRWVKDLREKVVGEDGDPIPVIILANKCDLTHGALNSGDLDAVCREFDILTWFPTSAKDDMNIDMAIDFLVDEILFTTKGGHPRSDEIESVRLSDSTAFLSSNGTISSLKSAVISSQKGCCS